MNVTLQTVGSYGSGIHPTGCRTSSSPPTGQWVHTTIFQVPENTRINMTIYQLRLGQPAAQPADRAGPGHDRRRCAYSERQSRSRVINSNAGNGVGHTFSIPTLGISVPLYGNNGNANLCARGAVHHELAPTSIIRFSFQTPKVRATTHGSASSPAPPVGCYGNGGPMQTVGWMGGFMQVSRDPGRRRDSSRGAAGPAATARPPQRTAPEGADFGYGPHHWWRILVIWFVLSAILDVLFYSWPDLTSRQGRIELDRRRGHSTSTSSSSSRCRS